MWQAIYEIGNSFGRSIHFAGHFMQRGNSCYWAFMQQAIHDKGNSYGRVFHMRGQFIQNAQDRNQTFKLQDHFLQPIIFEWLFLFEQKCLSLPWPLGQGLRSSCLPGLQPNFQISINLTFITPCLLVRPIQQSGWCFPYLFPISSLSLGQFFSITSLSHPC